MGSRSNKSISKGPPKRKPTNVGNKTQRALEAMGEGMGTEWKHPRPKKVKKK